MKKLFLVILLCAFAYSSFAQNVDLRRKIEVSGTAEQEVTPDIIYVSISLQEYMNGKTRVTIDQLESQLETAVKDAGIPKENFTINNISGWNNNYQKKKSPDFLASKQYRLKLSDLNYFDQILSAIDPKGIQSTNIDSYEYSKADQLKNQLKLKALLAARDKATFLLTGIGAKLGDPIDINEVDNTNYPQPRVYMAKTMSAGYSAPQSDIDFKTIKLSFQVNAVFEIIK
jgi:uncharacterized protein YggE